MQPSVGSFFTLGFLLCLGVNAGFDVKSDVASLQDRQDAIALNAKFKTLSPTFPCAMDEVACINGQFARCVQGNFVLTPCEVGLMCRASPGVGLPGTTIGCVAEDETMMRILARDTPQDPSQSSLCLDPAVLCTGFENDGQVNITSPGQVRSQTSSNNWINFCKTVDKPLTNGTQIPSGSCNPVPIGVLPSVDNLPSAKFIFPPNFAALAKHTMFTIQVAISHLETGWFTNPDTTFLSAPLVVNANGDIMGHSHVVIELLTGFGQTTPTVPKHFVFFKGLNLPAANGVLSTNVTGGLPAGYYRIAVINSGANHQPIASPVSQRGAMGDMVYFSVA